MNKSIKHVFHSFEFNESFCTKNAILSTKKYDPEILILGTFNPLTPKTNFADFFYGRNYFWPAFHNLFNAGKLELKVTRMPKRGKPKSSPRPSLQEILILCEQLKLTFADLVLSVLHNDADYKMLENDNINLNGNEYNLIQDSNKQGVGGLEQLNALGQLEWNTQNIIGYLIENTQIHSIYLTRKPTGIWAEQFHKIKGHKELQNRSFTNLFTPSGQGKPVFNSMERLICHWLNNTNNNFGKLDANWARKNVKDYDKFQKAVCITSPKLNSESQ